MKVKFTRSIIMCLLFLACNNRIDLRYNEVATIAILKSIREGQKIYKSNNPGKYATLQDLLNLKLIEGQFQNGAAYGYQYDLQLAGNGYKVFVTPVRFGEHGTGHFSFYLDETGVIRAAPNEGRPVGAEAFPIPKNSD